MSSWGFAVQREARRDDGPESATGLLDAYASQRGLSLRARQEMEQSLKAGSASWVETLSTGAAARAKPAHTCRHGKVIVPKPVAAHPPPAPHPARSVRRPHTDILVDTKHYSRDQYIRTRPIEDALTRRLEAQLVMEHGREGLKEMRRLAREQEQRKRVSLADLAPADTRQLLIDQIFDEIADRHAFIEHMTAAGGGHVSDDVKCVRLEIVRRLTELEKLGIDVSVGKPRGPTGSSNRNRVTALVTDGKVATV